MSRRRTTISNNLLSLSVDARGRIVSLRNKETDTELIDFPEASEAWRIVVPDGRHTLIFALGSKQEPAEIERTEDDSGQSIVIKYVRLQADGRKLPVRARFSFRLAHDGAEIVCRAEIDNRGKCAIDEVEFPVVGGLGGFGVRGKKELRLVQGRDRGGRFYGDVLNDGLPDTGRESNHYVREHETCMFANSTCSGEAVTRGANSPDLWLDLWSSRQGLYAGFHAGSPQVFAFKLEKFPKGVPNARAHAYPGGTDRWLRLYGLHMPQVPPGQRWVSEPVVLAPHAGDWHAGADRIAARYAKDLSFCQPPSWMDDFVGWTEIIGHLYTGEVFHDYAGCAEKVIRDAAVTGLNFVFYYGHTALGAEGADFDNGPCRKLGGERGFRRMVEALHAHGIRIMLLDHFHRWVNREVPEYQSLGLERWAMQNEEGNHYVARWWKETGLSSLYLEGPTPEWIEMCPACPEWREHYFTHVVRMAELGVDGLELDTFDPARCSNPSHPHAPGVNLFPAKLDLVREAKARARQINPEFAFFAETMSPYARCVVDGFYPNRYFNEDGRIYRYLFPEIREQAVLVGNYAYDQVNKALQLGLGVETEIWGLRKTAREACPELAKYIGEANRFKRRYPHLLIHGTFRDTLGARVKGEVDHSVLESPNGDKALILRNPTNRPVAAEAVLQRVRKQAALRLWRPFRNERRIRSMPLEVRLNAHEVAVLLAGEA